jgi:hypothetical protein
MAANVFRAIPCCPVGSGEPGRSPCHKFVTWEKETVALSQKSHQWEFMEFGTRRPPAWSLLAAALVTGMLIAVVAVSVCPWLVGLEPKTKTGVVESSDEKKRFVWKDLVAEDTAAFANNLREIGCPEDTIRRIVSTGKEVPAAEVPPATPTPAVTPVPDSQVAGGHTSPAPSPGGPADDLVIVAPEGRVSLPAAFQSLPQDAAMSEVQRVHLNNIQELFIKEVGGPDQDPASTEYQEKWRVAQRMADERFKAAFGQAEFVRRQMAVLRAEQAASNPSP